MSISIRITNVAGDQAEVEIPDPPPAEETPDATITLQSDGTDQTASFQSQLAAIPDGTALNPRVVTIHTPDRGPATLDGTPTVSNRTGLFLQFDEFQAVTALTGIEAGVVTAQGTSNRRHLAFANCDDMTVRGFTVVGPYAGRYELADPTFARWVIATAFEHGMALSGCRRMVVEDMAFSWIGGDGMYLGSGVATGGVERACEDITIRRVTGTYPGRQALAPVHVDGLLVEDYDVRLGARSGLDVEPNSTDEYVNDAVFRRVTMGCRFYPFVIGGSLGPTDGKAADWNKRQNITLEDCVGLNASSPHPAVQASRGGKNITVSGHTDLRQRSTSGMIFSAWEDGTVENSTVTSGPATPASCGVRLNQCTGDWTLTGNTFNGIPGGDGADQLYIADNGLVPTHSGNVWAMGTQSD